MLCCEIHAVVVGAFKVPKKYEGSESDKAAQVAEPPCLQAQLTTSAQERFKK